MDAGQQVEVMTQLFDAGLDLLAIYHSHPSGGPMPSEADLRQHNYPEAFCLVAALADGKWSLRAFRLQSAGWAEEPVSLRE
jgi:proteasome lid subunit RPN8/RPN11